MKRTTRIVSTITDREGLENAVGQYAKAILSKEALEVELSEKTREIREDYERRMALIDKDAERILADVKDYCGLHRADFPKDTKSLPLLHGTVGYRTGMPRVSLPRGTAEQEIVDELKASGLDEFVRVKEELNRDAVIEASKDADRAGVLAAHGLKVSQSERFFITIKREEAAK